VSLFSFFLVCVLGSDHNPPTAHSYDVCDVCTFPNQTDKDQLGPQRCSILMRPKQSTILSLAGCRSRNSRAFVLLNVNETLADLRSPSPYITYSPTPKSPPHPTTTAHAPAQTKTTRAPLSPKAVGRPRSTFWRRRRTRRRRPGRWYRRVRSLRRPRMIMCT